MMELDKQWNRAQYFFSKGKIKQAQELCESISRKNPTDLLSRELLGKIYGQAGNNKLALRQLRFVVEKNPASISAYIALGNVLVNVAEYEEAGEIFNHVLKIIPDSIEARLGMADLLTHTEQSSEAEKILNQINLRTPGDVDVEFRLGNISFKNGEYDKAKQHLVNVLKRKPNHFEAHHKVALIYHLTGYIDNAISHYKKSISIKPNAVEVYIDFGTILLQSGRFSEAEKLYRKFVKLAPGSHFAVSGLIRALSLNGKVDEAYNILKSFVDKGTLDANIALSAAEICAKIGKCEDAKIYIENTLDKIELAPKEETDLCYAMGAMYDKVNEYKKAYRYFERANNKRADNFSEIVFKSYIDSCIGTYSPGNLPTLARSSCDSAKPVFIVGMPRSGTSLVEQILSSHDQVYGAGELREIGDYVRQLPELLNTAKTYPSCVPELNKAILDELAQRYLSHIERISSGEFLVTDKMPQNFLYLGLIAQIFPNARIIHCQRDPRDVCLSIYFQNFSEDHTYSTRLENIVAYFNHYRRLMGYWKSVLKLPMLDVLYEDLVQIQKTKTEQILDFLDLPWDEKCIEFHKTSRAVATASSDQVNKSIYKTSVSRWKNYESCFGSIFLDAGL